MKTILQTIVLACFLLIGNTFHSQNLSCDWLHTFGNFGENRGVDADVDSEGNFLIVGHYSGEIDIDPSVNTYLMESNFLDCFLAKYSPNQELIWAHNFGGSNSKFVNKIHVLDDGRILLCGNFSQTCDFDFSDNEFLLQSNGFSDAFMAIYTSEGSFVNAVSIGGVLGDDVAFDAVTDSQGNFYFGGYFYVSADIDPSNNVYIVNEYTGASLDMYLVKLSSTYEFVWGGIVSGQGFEFPAALCIDAGDNLVIAGLTEANPDFDLSEDIQYANIQVDELNHPNCFVAKYSSEGALLDARIFGGTNDDYIVSMVPNAQGYLIAGTYSGSGDFDPGSGIIDFVTYGDNDAFLVQLDFEFSLVWSYNVGSEEPDYFNDIAIDEFGNIAAAGSFEMSIDFDNSESEFILSVAETVEGLYPDAIVVLLSSDGQFKEAKKFGGWHFDRASGVAISDNRILLTGYFTYETSIDACSANTNEDYQEDVFVLCLNSEYLLVSEENLYWNSAYPNPVDKFINIAFSKHESLGQAEIKLYDMQGSLVKSVAIAHTQATYMLDCILLENGTYLLAIEGAGFRTTQKIFVEH
ncbi:MAG: T9SS type A sorting domain-containing protein [Flavobacteriales bacterium]|nr:T9SS type A sorting domain-containing protein [Flavobacteriales bacterium]